MRLPKEWSVYMARCVDGSLYTGIAKDVRARLAAHNAGRGAAYTRSRRPVKLVYAEAGFTLSTALSREASIKSLERPGKLALLRAARAAKKILAVLVVLACAGLASATPSFDKEDAVALASATPQGFTYAAAAPAFTYPIRMFFIRGSSGPSVGSALSDAQGLNFTEDTTAGRLSTGTLPSVSASSITGCDVLPIPGGFRMEYSIVSTTGAFRIHSATSTDGLNWANDTGTRIDNGTTFLGSPKLVTLKDGSWRMYFTGNVDAGTDVTNRFILTSRSTNLGLQWSAPTVALSTMAFSVGASVLTNGFVRLYYSTPLPGSSTATVVRSALSSDVNGTFFTTEQPDFRISTAAASGSLDFPTVVRATDTFRWRMYYSYGDAGASTADVHTALTGAPAPAAVSPARVLNSQTTAALAISGDVFSAVPPGNPTVTLTLSGQVPLSPIAALVRTDDQTLTAQFNVLNQAPGFWNVVVVNGDGRTTTLPGAFVIDFPAGSVTLVNNLLRPRTGTATAITVTTFNAGHTTARLFTLDGRSVRTLFDGEQAKGVMNLSWDGRDGTGAPVASGLYLLHVTGAKIDAKSKIVVIR